MSRIYTKFFYVSGVNFSSQPQVDGLSRHQTTDDLFGAYNYKVACFDIRTTNFMEIAGR